MKESLQTKVSIFTAVSTGIIVTGLLGFLINCLTSYAFYKPRGGFFSLNKESVSFFIGIFSGILGSFGGLIIALLIRAINSGRIKSIIIGGIINTSIPIILIYTLDGGVHNSNEVFILTFISSFLAAGVIAGLLIYSFFSFTNKSARC